MPNLVKHSIVLTLSTHTRFMPPATIPFEAEGDEGDDTYLNNSHLYLDKTVWDEMGQPHTITMTVVPGDALNEEN